jgi:hypothetical protein
MESSRSFQYLKHLNKTVLLNGRIEISKGHAECQENSHRWWAEVVNTTTNIIKKHTSNHTPTRLPIKFGMFKNPN